MHSLKLCHYNTNAVADEDIHSILKVQHTGIRTLHICDIQYSLGRDAIYFLREKTSPSCSFWLVKFVRATFCRNTVIKSLLLLHKACKFLGFWKVIPILTVPLSLVIQFKTRKLIIILTIDYNIYEAIHRLSTMTYQVTYTSMYITEHC